MIDAAAILVDAMNNDPAVFGPLNGNIFAYRIPPDAQPPLALVMVPSTMPAAVPTSSWWNVMATIDIHTETPQASLAIANDVSKMAFQIVGDTSGGVVADCQVSSVQSITDGSWTPLRYRQIVTVDMTVRNVTVTTTAREPLKEVSNGN